MLARLKSHPALRAKSSRFEVLVRKPWLKNFAILFKIGKRNGSPMIIKL